FPNAEPEPPQRHRGGDMHAHPCIYEPFAPMVYTLACRMLASRSEAEDVLQETFVGVIRDVRTWRVDGEFGVWLRRIAVNKCLMHLRSCWVSRQAPLDGEPPAPARHAASGLALERALAALPAKARAVVLLHDVEGYTHQEIGRLLRRHARFSTSQLARAHGRLRVLLRDETTKTEAELCESVLKTC